MVQPSAIGASYSIHIRTSIESSLRPLGSSISFVSLVAVAWIYELRLLQWIGGIAPFHEEWGIPFIGRVAARQACFDFGSRFVVRSSPQVEIFN
jgi:hypothetical protein